MDDPITIFFPGVEDPRTGKNVRYPLNEILLVALVTLLTGRSTYVEMADVGRCKIGFFKRFFPYANGTPSEDTFRYVFMLLDPKSFGECFAEWISFLHGHVEGLVAIDGKCCRGASKGAGSSPLTVVNAFCRERGIVLAGVDVPGKSNEITALPGLLRALKLKGCTVTLDAMGCQREVVSQIVEQKGDYLISLKGNQGNLHRDVEEFFEAHREADPGFCEPDFGADVFESEEKNRGRHHRRRVVATSDFCPGLEAYKAKWAGLKTVVLIESWRSVKGGEEAHEKRYSITSLPPDAARLADVVRGHWSVENRAHWVLDVHFGEDACRARAGDGAKNLATLRRLCLNIARHSQRKLPSGKSLRRILNCCGLDDEHLEKVLAIGLNLHANPPGTA